MARQVNISQVFNNVRTRLSEVANEKLKDEVLAIGEYAVSLSPVDTGAFVTSWSLRPLGSRGGRMRSSAGRPSVDEGVAKAEASSNLVADVSQFSNKILENGGAVLINRAKHSDVVDDKYAITESVRNRFRNG